ncbi:hypothetical protein BDV10DRAFT_162139 [Aspergillus recurvatus]
MAQHPGLSWLWFLPKVVRMRGQGVFNLSEVLSSNRNYDGATTDGRHVRRIILSLGLSLNQGQYPGMALNDDSRLRQPKAYLIRPPFRSVFWLAVVKARGPLTCRAYDIALRLLTYRRIIVRPWVVARFLLFCQLFISRERTCTLKRWLQLIDTMGST